MSDLRTCSRCGQAVPSDAPQGQCPRCLVGKDAPCDHHAAPQPTYRPGRLFQPPPIHELQEFFPQFQLLELIGRGGMGAVYLARQRSLDRLVAVKILPPEIAASSGFEDRFTREGQTLARLNHPGIVAVYDFGKSGPYAYLVLEYVEGVNLRDLLRDGHLPPEDALQVVPQLCDALHAAHAQGVVHRDIKPENILLTTTGRVKVADFGVAKLLQSPTDAATQSGAVVGTFQYMAPEQFERPSMVDHRADIYSLGVVFYEMLTGELPLGRFPSPSQCRDVSPGLDRIVLRALEKQPEKRYPSAVEVRTDVESLAGDPHQPDPAAAQRDSHPTASESHPAARATAQAFAHFSSFARHARTQAAARYGAIAPHVTEQAQSLHRTMDAALLWIAQQWTTAVTWLRKRPPSILWAGAGWVALTIGLFAMAQARDTDDAIAAAVFFGLIGTILLRIGYVFISEGEPTQAERVMILYPLRLVVGACLVALVLWPLVLGAGLALALLEGIRGAPAWLDSVREVVVAAIGVTLLVGGANLALLATIAIFFPTALSTLIRPLKIPVRTAFALVFLCGAIAVATVGGMIVYSVAQQAMDAGGIATRPAVSSSRL